MQSSGIYMSTWGECFHQRTNQALSFQITFVGALGQRDASLVLAPLYETMSGRKKESNENSQLRARFFIHNSGMWTDRM